jgi:hypothetical protein
MFILVAFEFVGPHSLFAQKASAQKAGIVPNGNTQTRVSTTGAITNVTTNTIRGTNAYNSFSIFNVNQGKTVNLFLPSGTDNLLNLVNSQSSIDGILNSIKNGKIGGNLFFVNPYGFIVGKNGVVNAGAFLAVTPTSAFMSQFFTAPGVPSPNATASLLNGTVPITPDGLISVQGKINAAQSISLRSGNVHNSGSIASGAVFSGTKPDFSDVVNVAGLQSGTSISVQNGDIEIQATGDFENSGRISTSGANNLNAGNINVHAGNDIKLDPNSLMSARGLGQNSNGGKITILADKDSELGANAVVTAAGGNVSGNGGSVDFSAKGTATLKCGILQAGAVHGSAGTVSVDPTDLNITQNDTPNDGSNLVFSGDTITVAPGIVISSRQIGPGTDFLNSPSTDNSGSIILTANSTSETPTITIGNGAQILAHATNGFSPGDITLTASRTSANSQAVAAANINIGNALIQGGNINISATAQATADSSTNGTVATALNDTSLGFLVNGPVSANTSKATSGIAIGDSASSGNAHINATGTITIESGATSTTTSDLTGISGFAYGQSNSTATANVANTAALNAGGAVALNAKSTNTLSVQETTTQKDQGVVAVAYGNSSSNSTAEVDGTVTGRSVQIGATNTNSFSTGASATDYDATTGNGGGAGIALGFYESKANTAVTGAATATASDVQISSNTTNTDNTTRSSSSVPSQGFKAKVAAAHAWTQNLGNALSQTTVTSILGSSPSVAPQGNSTQLGLAGAVSVAETTNTATTTVSGNVTSKQGNVNIGSQSTDNPQISAAGSVSGQTTDLGGAVAVSDFHNTASTYVNGNATVTGGNAVSITADADALNPALQQADLIGSDFTAIDSASDLANYTDMKDLAENVKSGIEDLDVFTTSFVNTGLSTAGKGASGFGIAGAVNLLGLTNQSIASVTGSASVTANTDDLSVNATSKASAINVAGMGLSGSKLIKLNPGVKAGTSIGGSYNGTNLLNTSQAYIGDGTTATAAQGSVNVNATTNTFAVDLAQAGDKATQFGIVGTFDDGSLTANSEASIQSQANVNAGKDVNVTASNPLLAIALGGALGTGGTAEVGVAINWNQINDTTLAYIGDPNSTRTSSCTGCAVTAANNVNVTANSSEDVYGITFAATKSGASGSGADGESSSTPAAKTAPSAPTSGGSNVKGETGDNGAGGGGYGFGISGEIAFNEIDNGSGGPGVITKAFINNGANVTATNGNIKQTATDTSFAVAAGVAGTVGQTAALAGAYSQNTIDKQIEASASNATLSAKGLNLQAIGNGSLFAVTAGGGVNTESGVAIAGSINNNDITNTVTAEVGDNAQATGIGSNGVTINASEGGNGDRVLSVAGGFGLSVDGGGVGAAIDAGSYTNNVSSTVDSGANLDSTGNIQVTASTNVTYLPIAVSLAAGGDFGASGSLAADAITDTTTSTLGGTVSTTGNLVVGSNDSSSALIVAGGLGVGGEVGVGVTALIPQLNRTTESLIANNASVSAQGNGSPVTYDGQSINGILLDAKTSGHLQDYSAAGAVSGSVSVAGAVILNPFFASNPYTLKDDTEANVGAGALVNGAGSGAAGQSVTLLATDTSGIQDAAGMLSLAGDLGLGVGFDAVSPSWTVNASIGSGATINAAANVIASSNLQNSFTSYVVSGSGSAGVSGAGAVTILNNTTNTNAYIDSGATVIANGNVVLAANRDTALNVVDGGAALGLYAGINGAVTDVSDDNTIQAYVGTNANVTALGQGTGTSTPNGTINGLSITATGTDDIQTFAAGAAGGLGAISGSILDNSFTENTTAKVDSNAAINGTNMGGSSIQGVNLYASEITKRLAAGAGALAVGAIGIGVAVDAENVQKNTTAGIDGGAVINANGTVNVAAVSQENINSYTGAVGLGVAGLAGTSADYQTNPIQPITKAYISSAAVGAASLGVDASENLNFTANTGELSDGGVALGAATALVSANANTSASVDDSNVTLGPNGALSVTSVYVGNVQGTALSGSGGVFSGNAAYASIVDNGSNSASLSGTMPQAGAITVDASTTRTVNAAAGGLSEAGLGAGASVAQSSTPGSTTASATGNIGQTSGEHVASLFVDADDNTTAISNASTISAGIGSGQYNQANADIEGAVESSIGAGSNINVSGGLTAQSLSTDVSSVTLKGINIGGITVGGADSEASSTPTVSAFAGDNVSLNAEKFTLSATYQSNGTAATSHMSTGSLANANVSSSATANDSPSVSAYTGDANNTASTITASNISISTSSTTSASADFEGNDYSGVNIPGNSTATANIANNNQVYTGNNVTLQSPSGGAGNILLQASSSNLIPVARDIGSSAGLISVGGKTDGSTAYACIDAPSSCSFSGTPSTSVSVGPGSTLNGGGNPSSTVTLDATSNDRAINTLSQTAVVSGIATNNNWAYETINDNPNVSVSNGTINTGTASLTASIGGLLANSKANSVTSAADSFSTSQSQMNVTVDPSVILTSASISAPQSLTMNATVANDSTKVQTTNLATASINGFTGSITSTAINNSAYNPLVSVDANSVLSTGDLDVESSSPIVARNGGNPFYSNIANPENNTVVSWTLTTVEETVDEVVGWIPFVGDLVKSVTKDVTKWVETITNSTTDPIKDGQMVSGPSIAMNGTLNQEGGGGALLTATPGPNGATFSGTGISAQNDGNGDIIVNNITNSGAELVTLNAPNGTITGRLTINRDNAYPTINITNNTGENLIINQIQPLALNQGNPDLTVTAGDSSTFSTTFATHSGPTVITILDNSVNGATSNVMFNGYVNNPSGILNVTDKAGSILGGSNGLLENNQFSFTASGSVGTTAKPLTLRMVGDPNLTPAQLSAQAGADVNIDAGLVSYSSSAPSSSSQTITPANISSILAGGSVNLDLGAPTTLVVGVDANLNRTTTPYLVTSTYDLQNVSGTGDVNINQAGGNVSVGSVTSVGGNVSLTAQSGDVELGTVNSRSGTTNVTASNSIIDMNHNSTSDINTASLNLTATNGSIGTTTDPENINSSYNGATGQVTASANLGVYLNQVTGDLNLRTVRSNTSDAALTSAGSIMDTSGTAVSAINANNVNLTAANGSIGGGAGAGNTLDIDTPGQLTATANQNVNVTQTTGPVNVNILTAANGNVALTAANGDVDLGTVNSTKGTATIVASGSISDANSTAASAINAVSVNLTAQVGSIGGGTGAGNTLNIDTTGQLTVRANQNANISQTTGPLQVNTITAMNGNVNLTAANADIDLGTVNSTKGNATIVASGSISDVNNTPGSSVNANNVNLTASNGSIGGSTGAGNTLDINATGQLTATANQNANVTQTTGPMQVNTVTATNGNVNLTAANGDVDLGTVNSTKGNTTITASGSISDNNSTAASSINGVNVNLAARGGSIGGGVAAANTLDVDAAGQLTATANQNANVTETTGPLNVNTVTATNGNVNLTAPIGDVDLGTVNSTKGNTNIFASGSITDTNGTAASAINARNVNLTASNGSIGGVTVGALDINSTGQLTATANQNANVTETTGPLDVNTVTATNGNVNLTASIGDVDLGTVNSTKGNTNIFASGSIIDINSTAVSAINANNVNLIASNGFIGGGILAGGALDIDATGQLTATANQFANVTETTGPMSVSTVTSSKGDINLATRSGDVDLGTVTAKNGNITVASSGSILNTTGGSSSSVNLTGDNINLTAINGSIGTSVSPLFVNNQDPTTLTLGVPTGFNLLNTYAHGDT